MGQQSLMTKLMSQSLLGIANLSKSFSNLSRESITFESGIEENRKKLDEIRRKNYEALYPQSLSFFGIPSKVTSRISRGEGEIVVLESPPYDEFGPECIRTLQKCKPRPKPVPIEQAGKSIWYCRYPVEASGGNDERRKNERDRVAFLSYIYSKRDKKGKRFY